jgi:hypothetical protein
MTKSSGVYISTCAKQPGAYHQPCVGRSECGEQGANDLNVTDRRRCCKHRRARIQVACTPRDRTSRVRDRRRFIGLEQGSRAIRCIRRVHDAPAAGIEDGLWDVGSFDELALHHAAVVLSLLSHLERGCNVKTCASMHPRFIPQMLQVCG